MYTIRHIPARMSQLGNSLPEGWRVYMQGHAQPVTVILPTLADAERARGALIANDRRHELTAASKRAALKLLAP